MTLAPVSTASLATSRLYRLLDTSEPLVEAAGVVVMTGTVSGTPVVAFATDSSVQGGALGIDGCRAIADATDLAVSRGVPVIGIWHSGGARLREGVGALDAVAKVFAAQTRASGRVPQLSVVLGPAAGGAAYGPALTDVVVLGPEGRVFVTGPDVVRRVTGEDVDMLRLGGPEPHGRRSGVVHLVTDTDDAALDAAAELAVLLNAQGSIDLDRLPPRPDPSRTLPPEARRAYDMRAVVTDVLDEPGLELQANWAPNVLTVLGRLGGRTVGVVANNPLRLGGCLDASSGEKAARFVRMCDAFGVPLLFLVDVPGYLPGVGQEWDGVVRRGAKLLHAYAAASVPRITVVVHKSFGGAYIAMGSKGLGADAVFAWPGAQIDVMGASAAVEILNRRELAALEGEDRAAAVVLLADAHAKETGGLQRAVDGGFVDAVINPADTRVRVAAAIAAARPVRGLNANIPL
ncbi:MAG: carboxyl transferase [Frankiales bacterium]|nr:carboxyl transferase [Frankiales bacterium]